MKTFYYDKLSEKEIIALTKRPAINFEKISETVKPILNDIKENGLPAVLKYAKQFDGFEEDNLRVSEKEFSEAENNLDPKVKKALETAYENIYKFHKEQLPKNYSIETTYK